MTNRNVKSLDAHKVAARKQLVLVETAEKLLEARDRLTSRREHLAVGEGDGVPEVNDPILGNHAKLSLCIPVLDLSLEELPLYTGDNFQEVLTALAKSCEFAAEAMLSKAGIK